MRYLMAALTTLAALVTGGTAKAEEIMRFDVKGHCEEIAGFGGTYSEQMYGFCVDEEQKNYDALKPNWAAIPSSIRNHCAEIASFAGPGSYQMLKFCIDEELKSREANSSKEFEY